MNRRKDYLPVGNVAIDAEEYEQLKRKAELYDMYQKQVKTTRNGVFMSREEYNELVKKAEMCDHMIALENSRLEARMEFE